MESATDLEAPLLQDHSKSNASSQSTHHHPQQEAVESLLESLSFGLWALPNNRHIVKPPPVVNGPLEDTAAQDKSCNVDEPQRTPADEELRNDSHESKPRAAPCLVNEERRAGNKVTKQVSFEDEQDPLSKDVSKDASDLEDVAADGATKDRRGELVCAEEEEETQPQHLLESSSSSHLARHLLPLSSIDEGTEERDESSSSHVTSEPDTVAPLSPPPREACTTVPSTPNDTFLFVDGPVDVARNEQGNTTDSPSPWLLAFVTGALVCLAAQTAIMFLAKVLLPLMHKRWRMWEDVVLLWLWILISGLVLVCVGKRWFVEEPQPIAANDATATTTKPWILFSMLLSSYVWLLGCFVVFNTSHHDDPKQTKWLVWVVPSVLFVPVLVFGVLYLYETFLVKCRDKQQRRWNSTTDSDEIHTAETLDLSPQRSQESEVGHS